MKSLEDLLKQCEELVRSGNVGTVHRRLASVKVSQVPRKLRLPLANLCRRSNLVHLGLKILAPLMLSKKGNLLGEATPHELAEYAALLQKSDALKEAKWTLQQVNELEAPEALLYRVFCHF